MPFISIILSQFTLPFSDVTKHMGAFVNPKIIVTKNFFDIFKYKGVNSK